MEEQLSFHTLGHCKDTLLIEFPPMRIVNNFSSLFSLDSLKGFSGSRLSIKTNRISIERVSSTIIEAGHIHHWAALSRNSSNGSSKVLLSAEIKSTSREVHNAFASTEINYRKAK